MEASYSDRVADGRMFDFARFLHEQEVRASTGTLMGYISTVRQHIGLHVGWTFKHSPLLSKFALRCAQVPHERNFRDPATRVLLQKVIGDTSIDIGVRAAACVGWNGLLRVAEYCVKPKWRSALDKNLLHQDIERCKIGSEFGYRVRLKCQKQDRYNMGDWQYFKPRPDDPLCPVAILDIYFASTSTPRTYNQPAFCRSPLKGKSLVPVARADLDKALKRWAPIVGLNPRYISTHSLRIGGAFTLADSGTPMQLIQQQGRWSSRGLQRNGSTIH